MKIGNKIIFAKTNTALSDQMSISSYLPTLLPECHQLHQEEGRPGRADAHPRRWRIRPDHRVRPGLLPQPRPYVPLHRHRVQTLPHRPLPFYDDKYSNETVSFAPVRHVTQTNLRTKNREFGFTISWFFQRGKENHSAKSLENSDVDSGEFRFWSDEYPFGYGWLSWFRGTFSYRML